MEDFAGSQFSAVHNVQKRVGMPGLIMGGKLSRLGGSEDALYSDAIPQDPIHMDAVDHEPTAAIDPIAPFAFAADEVFPVGVVQPLGNRIELAIIDRALVIQADVDVGTFRGAARGP